MPPARLGFLSREFVKARQQPLPVLERDDTNPVGVHDLGPAKSEKRVKEHRDLCRPRPVEPNDLILPRFSGRFRYAA
jgi:hypothetical protein